ncbi:uncharacterized protein CLUP02_06015 [Colletotrichum lupini]|uniref:Uncharacterized protein n=1 Tax=Colletotrichum lupini TaxID=145971 RepID=A0A9Q8SNC3_9PEZI|nr:uncharacterized protein CLUP02_06015 [Colletotrichum lupini]UQC80532.1 hypothetical protein CLUP02_06015 [Colletotrichum lupini]
MGFVSALESRVEHLTRVRPLTGALGPWGWARKLHAAARTSRYVSIAFARDFNGSARQEGLSFHSDRPFRYVVLSFLSSLCPKSMYSVPGNSWCLYITSVKALKDTRHASDGDGDGDGHGDDGSTRNSLQSNMTYYVRTIRTRGTVEVAFMNEWLDRPREWGPFCVSTASGGTSSLGRRRCFFPFHHHPPSHTSFSCPSPTCSSFPLTFGSAPYTLIPRPSLICKGQLAIAEKLTIDPPPPSWPFSFFLQYCRLFCCSLLLPICLVNLTLSPSLLSLLLFMQGGRKTKAQDHSSLLSLPHLHPSPWASAAEKRAARHARHTLPQDMPSTLPHEAHDIHLPQLGIPVLLESLESGLPHSSTFEAFIVSNDRLAVSSALQDCLQHFSLSMHSRLSTVAAIASKFRLLDEPKAKDYR